MHIKIGYTIIKNHDPNETIIKKSVMKKLTLLTYFIMCAHTLCSAQRLTDYQWEETSRYARNLLAYERSFPDNESYEHAVLRNISTGMPLPEREKHKARKALGKRLHLAEKLIIAQTKYKETGYASYFHMAENLSNKFYKRFVYTHENNTRLFELTGPSRDE